MDRASVIGLLEFLVEFVLPVLIVQVLASNKYCRYSVLTVDLFFVNIDFTFHINNIVYGQAVISRQKEVHVFYRLLAVFDNQGGLFR